MKSCKICGAGYGDTIFLWLSDKLWKSIDCGPSDYLCTTCILERLSKIRTFVYIIDKEGEHEIESTGAKITMAYRNF